MSYKLAARCQQQRDYSPVSWTEYFDEALDISPDCNQEQAPAETKDGSQEETCTKPPRETFRVYTKNFKHPYAPQRLPDQKIEITQSQFDSYNKFPTVVALHGGGYSALTWAQFTRHLERQCHCRALAIDLRSHGDTKTDNDDDMNIETLVDDVIRVTHATHRLYGFMETPNIILVGHSMGGAIAIKCSTRCIESMPSLISFVIIDVVEGTAKDALPLMMTVLNTRPNRFPSIENAIEWSVRSGMAKNLEAARVSMPGNLLNIASGHLAIHDLEDNTEARKQSKIIKHKFHISIENLLAQKTPRLKPLPRGLPLSPRVAALKGTPGPSLVMPSPVVPDLLEEADESGEDNSSSTASPLKPRDQIDEDGYKRPPAVELESGYCWRTDLAKTQPHWPGWFEGLSEQMLSAPVQGKFLLLAGIDRLDKTLTIGQMQGKFMMKVLPKCGHAVHEDSPERVALEIGQFLVRNKFTSAVVENE